MRLQFTRDSVYEDIDSGYREEAKKLLADADVAKSSNRLVTYWNETLVIPEAFSPKALTELTLSNQLSEAAELRELFRWTRFNR